MPSSHSDPDVALVAGFGFGLLSFYKGFRVYREFRVVEDTPEIPIRSIPMGLVHIHGRAIGEERVTSPVTHAPCFYYKVDIQQWKSDSKGGGNWSHYRTDTDGVTFYLEDQSGKVLLDAHGAEFDLVKQGEREIGGHASPSSGASGATEEELRSYLSAATARHLAGYVGRALQAAGPMSDPAKEQQRQAMMEFMQRPFGGPAPLQKLMGLGMARMEEKLQSAGPQSDPAKEQARQEMMQAMNYPPGSPEFLAHLQRAAESQHDPEQAQKFVSSMNMLQRVQAGGLQSVMPPTSGRFRFTEYCLLPGQAYDVTGSCVENPAPKDQHDRNLILKGQNEPTYLISWKAQKQVESGLRRRAALMIFGGGALALACLGILLARHGLL